MEYRPKFKTKCNNTSRIKPALTACFERACSPSSNLRPTKIKKEKQQK
jgi:hypothetical protein